MRASYAEARELTRVLSPGTLASFAHGLTWPEIHRLDVHRGDTWWRCAVAEAEHRGLIEWDRAARVWRLTDDGRAHVRDVA